MVSKARFTTWQATDGSNIMRFNDPVIEVWNGTAWESVGATGPATVSGGDEVVTVGGYTYHVFTNSGTLTVTQDGNADVMVVGGGAGGGYDVSGGGGAGGFADASYFTKQILTSGTVAVTVGAGAPGGVVDALASNGSNSTFVGSSTLTGLGGGTGGVNASKNGATGGSGGGGHHDGLGGTASGPLANDGGDGDNLPGSGLFTAGGGGGATAAGSNGVASTLVAGAGGEGETLTTIDSNLTSGNFSSFSGMTVIASGGGGAGLDQGGGSPTGGDGGTGAGDGGRSGSGGSELRAATDATSYGSGGGGGAWQSYGTGYGGDGFDGIVIVRVTA